MAGGTNADNNAAVGLDEEMEQVRGACNEEIDGAVGMEEKMQDVQEVSRTMLEEDHVIVDVEEEMQDVQEVQEVSATMNEEDHVVLDVEEEVQEVPATMNEEDHVAVDLDEKVHEVPTTMNEEVQEVRGRLEMVERRLTSCSRQRMVFPCHVEVPENVLSSSDGLQPSAEVPGTCEGVENV